MDALVTACSLSVAGALITPIEVAVRREVQSLFMSSFIMSDAEPADQSF